jgi:AraC-like DNA-binding protein
VPTPTIARKPEALPDPAPRVGAPATAPATFRRRRWEVERVIAEMRVRAGAGGTMSLDEMAAVARLSPYHFIHLFHAETGVAPLSFLSALRLHEAKRRIMDSSATITEVCFDFGYSSQGTFTRRFTALVGMPPRRWRSLARSDVACAPDDGRTRPARPGGAGPQRWVVRGAVSLPDGAAGTVVVGLYPTGLCHANPIAHAVARDGRYEIASDGARFRYLFAARLDEGRGGAAAWLHETALRACRTVTPPAAAPAGDTEISIEVNLRVPCPTDPPILAALPLLAG